MLRGISDSTTLIGWFHSTLSRQNGTNNTVLPQDFMGIMIEGPSAEGFYFRPAFRMHGGNDRIAQPGPYIYPDGVKRNWTLNYAPFAEGNSGKITVTLDNETIEYSVSPADRAIGARFDRFGIVTTQIDGHYQFVYFDDLNYTAQQVPPTSSNVSHWMVR